MQPVAIRSVVVQARFEITGHGWSGCLQKEKEAIDQTGLDFKTLSRNEKTV